MPKRIEPPKFLTGNDLAIAETAIGLALAWWKKQPGRSGYKRAQIARLKELGERLSALCDHAYPYRASHEDEDAPDHGDEPIMKADQRIIRATRRAAQTFNSKR